MSHRTVVTSPFARSVALVVGMLEMSCGRTSEAERRASDEATALAEDMAEEQSLTSAAVETGAQESANGEIVAAFRLEQSDYRRRLREELDRLDKSLVRPGGALAPRGARRRALRARRDLLKEDLDSVNRSTEQDWATLRSRVERDLDLGKGTGGVPR